MPLTAAMLPLAPLLFQAAPAPPPALVAPSPPADAAPPAAPPLASAGQPAQGSAPLPAQGSAPLPAGATPAAPANPSPASTLAGPPTTSARSPGPSLEPSAEPRLFGEAFARYAHERWGGEAARAFDLPRARLGADAALSDWFAGRALLETVRSAAPGSLYGVDGDSIVLRAREIYGELRTPAALPASLRLRLGLVPTLAVTPLEQQWGRRVVAPTLEEASGLLSPADLGAVALGQLPAGLGEVAVGVFNGEGFTQREQNEGKSVQARVWLTPLDRVRPAGLSVHVLGHVENGSLGPTQSRANRYTGALSVLHALGAAGVDVTFADGVQGNSGQRARAASAWLRVGPWRGVELLGRLDQLDPDRRSHGGDDRLTAWQVGAGYHAPLPRPDRQAFELYLTYRHAQGGPLARASDPRLPQRGPRLDLRVSF